MKNMKSLQYIAVIKKAAASRNGLPPYYRFFENIRAFKIPHSVAYRCWMTKGFPRLWHALDIPADGEVRLATIILANTSKLDHAKRLVESWWRVHNVEPDDHVLALALDIAWKLTEEARTRFQLWKTNSERRKAYIKKERTKPIKAYSPDAHMDRMFSPLIGVSQTVRQMIVVFLRSHPHSTPKEIAEGINVNRKTVRNKLSEMHSRGEVERETIKAGVRVTYQLK